MKRIIRTLAVCLCLMALCPTIAKAQFGKAAYGNNMTGGLHGKNSSNGYLQRGFKLGIDIDNSFGTYEVGYSFIGSINAGYQVSPYFYLGTSICPGFNCCDGGMVATALEIKAYYPKGKAAPMASLRLGYEFTWIEPYLSAGVGSRFAITSGLGFNLQFIAYYAHEDIFLGLRTGIDF